MKLKHPTDIYKQIYLSLMGPEGKKKRVTPEYALVALDGIFR